MMTKATTKITTKATHHHNTSGTCVAGSQDVSLEATPELVASASSLSAYLGVCPTCLGWEAEGDALDTITETCPTCGQKSVEWALSCEIDAVLRELNSLEALSRAIDEM